MEKLGYGPNKRLSVTVATRNLAPYRDPRGDPDQQLKEIYIDAISIRSTRRNGIPADAQGFQVG